MTAINAPTPLSNVPISAGAIQFPSDLWAINSTPTNITGGSSAVSSGTTTYSNSSGGYYTSLTVVPANSVFGSGTTTVTTGTSKTVYLPLPAKMQDQQLALWQDVSYLDYVPSLAATAQLAGRATSSGGDQAVNPFMFQIFKQNLFRQFTLQWVLAPNSPAESSTLLEILYLFKTASLPGTGTVPGLLTYPYLVIPKFNPNAFLFDFKPCSISSCEIDYSGTGHGPAFFNSGAPVICSLTLQLKEVQLQVRSDVSGRGGSLTSSMST